jgi:hypothetical protein
MRARPLVIGVRVTVEEMTRLRRAARLRGVSVPELMRQITLGSLDGPEAAPDTSWVTTENVGIGRR